jgi:hypothetical protein
MELVQHNIKSWAFSPFVRHAPIHDIHQCLWTGVWRRGSGKLFAIKTHGGHHLENMNSDTMLTLENELMSAVRCIL